MVRVSVIVPAYNVEDYLSETLKSLAEQTLDDFEVIIVNDGSTDGTADIINDFCEQYHFMRAVYQENAGVSAARNKGIAVSEGKYIAFLDGDDLFAPDTLENFYLTAEENNSDLVIGKIENFDSKNNISYQEHSVNLSKKADVDPFDTEILWNFLIGNKLYRADLIRSSHSYFPNLKYSEDGAFLMHYVYACKRINGCENAVLRYRRRTSDEERSVSQSISLSLLQDYIKAHKIVYGDAETALKNLDDSVKENYLEEVIYKEAHVLIMQFYRLFWRADEECRAYIKEQFTSLWNRMTEKTQKNLADFHDDIDLENLKVLGKEMAENPTVSVIVKKISASKEQTESFINSVYSQSLVNFEVIIPQSLADSGKIPENWFSCENMVILPDKGFGQAAKEKAKGKYKVVFSKLYAVDTRVFRFVCRSKSIPDGIKRKFFSLIVKATVSALRFMEERKR